VRRLPLWRLGAGSRTRNARARLGAESFNLFRRIG